MLAKKPVNYPRPPLRVVDKGSQQAASAVQPKLLERMRDAIRYKHYSIRTEQSYLGWARRFILFHDKRHPETMGEVEITEFLTSLAKQNVTASTQNQALSALLFLYREVLKKELAWLDDVERAKKPSRLPVVLTQHEVHNVLEKLDGAKWLMGSLLYGAGLRLMECLRLRVKDVDFEQHQITVRDGKGMKDRVTMLPDRLVEPLKQHLQKVRALHEKDLEEGFGAVYLPFALERKYPAAPRAWGWVAPARPAPATFVHPAHHNMFSLRRSVRWTRAAARSGAIMWMKMYCSAA